MIAFSIIVGCSSNKTNEKVTEAMEAVLKSTLTGPEDELIRINELKADEWAQELRKYEENRFREYFANDESYEDFVNVYGAVLMIDPMRNDYQLEVKNIEFEKTDSDEIIYHFEVEVEYKKNGSDASEVGIVKGQANLNEEYKIERMEIRYSDVWSNFYS